MTDYFALFQLPISLRPDQDLVKQQYYRLSREHHPDRATGAADMQITAEVNNGFRILRSPDATMEYILKLRGLLADQEKYELPPAFLMDMMDLNELLTDTDPGDAAAVTAITTTVDGHLQQWEQEVSLLKDRFDAGEQTEPIMRQLKEFYFRKKYLLRVKERIDKFAAH